jgi:hypothetical protein
MVFYIECTLQVSKTIIFSKKSWVYPTFFPAKILTFSHPHAAPSPHRQVTSTWALAVRLPEGEAALPPRKGDFVELIVRRMPRMAILRAAW